MTAIEPRWYRNGMGEGRFISFVVTYKDSDLWIGVDKDSYDPGMKDFAQAKLTELRTELEGYILNHSEFATSFSPFDVQEFAPDMAIDMAQAGKFAGTGPMASVAGAFSEYLGNTIQQKFIVNELLIENGGDIYAKLNQDLILAVYAGRSALSGKVGIEIPAEETPLGICTSAGTVGPSVSFGKADAVMVVCKSTLLADAFATAIGNRVKQASDIDVELKMTEQHPQILSVLIICGGAVGIRGKYALKMLQ
ncbi:MAG: UPF0280 family protein [Prolixibacteraceae bacterium]